MQRLIHHIFCIKPALRLTRLLRLHWSQNNVAVWSRRVFRGPELTPRKPFFYARVHSIVMEGSQLVKRKTVSHNHWNGFIFVCVLYVDYIQT